MSHINQTKVIIPDPKVTKRFKNSSNFITARDIIYLLHPQLQPQTQAQRTKALKKYRHGLQLLLLQLLHSASICVYYPEMKNPFVNDSCGGDSVDAVETWKWIFVVFSG